jgi:hypothetical protein
MENACGSGNFKLAHGLAKPISIIATTLMSHLMPEDPKKTLTSYPEVSRLITELLEVNGWEGESEYYPFSSVNPSGGFLEIVYPVTDASGRSLRGASGNGPIFIFLYRLGTWTYLGEMYGARATAIATDSTTEFKVYAHVSASAGVEREYRLSEGKYVCVSEEDVNTD